MATREFTPGSDRRDFEELLAAVVAIWNAPENLGFLSYSLRPFAPEVVRGWFECRSTSTPDVGASPPWTRAVPSPASAWCGRTQSACSSCIRWPSTRRPRGKPSGVSSSLTPFTSLGQRVFAASR
jgi:hypothetical protein